MNVEEAMHANAIAMFVQQTDGHVTGTTDLGDYAIEYAARGWPVFPLRYDKTPAVHGGLLSATTHLGTVAAWWFGTHRGASIGLRVPDNLIVMDVDPRNGGEPNWRRLTSKYGNMPETMTVYSGRGDGGRHYYLRKLGEPERITTRRLREELGVDALGVDVKTNRGYVVAPPSPHPATGNPYRAEHFGQFADCPGWLWDRLTSDAPVRRNTVAHEYDNDSPADWFTAVSSWRTILEPHGWRVVGYDGDSDGSMWQHPAATSPLSATVRHGNLFVYSPNTPFDITEPGTPIGYTRFRAYAVLNFNGDLTSAALDVARQRMRLGL